MRFPFPRRGHFAAIFTGIVIAAGCSSSSPPAQAFVYGTITPTTGGSCAGIQGMTEFLEIGNMGTNGVTANRVADGGANHISCSVKGSGSTFAISLSATSQSTTMGGSITLTGGDISSSSGGTNLSGIFVGTSTGGTATSTNGQYSADNCTLTYTTPEGTGGIDPGRVWAHVECDGATNGNLSVEGGGPSTCNIEVDFVFENCSS
jgi:hypothetical protein